MKIVYIIAMTVCCNLWAIAAENAYSDPRNRKIDSLEQILADPATKANTLLLVYGELSREYVEVDHEKTVYYSQKGISLAKSLNEWRMVGELYKNMGYSYYSRNRLDTARICFENVMNAAEQASNEADRNYLMIKAYLHQGIVSDVEGKLHDAMNNYLKALRIAEASGNKQEMQKLYGNLGSVCIALENDSQAETYFLKGQALCRQLNDSIDLYYHLVGLSDIYNNRGVHKKAIALADSALQIVSNRPSLYLDKLYVLLLMSRIYNRGMGDHAKAMEYAQEAMKTAETLDSPQNICWALEAMANICIDQGRYADAEILALRALETDSTDMFTNVKLFEYLTRANIMQGKRERADACLTQLIDIANRSSNKNYQTAFSEMEVKYETEKKELKISAMESEKRLMIWLSATGGAVLLLALTAFFFLWRWTVQKKRLAEQQILQFEQEKQLIATQAVLDGEVQERTRLARDLHDSLGSILAAAKYNLTNIKRVSAFGKKDMDSYNKAVDLLDDSMSEMRRVAHHLMPDSLSRFGLKAALGDFCETLPSVQFAWYGDESRLDPKREEVVYRIAHELISNALKHSGAERIFVQIVQEPDRIALTVQDDGRGFDPAAAVQGMGLSNIRTRVASFGGVINIDSKAGEGTEINIELRITN